MYDLSMYIANITRCSSQFVRAEQKNSYSLAQSTYLRDLQLEYSADAAAARHI